MAFGLRVDVRGSHATVVAQVRAALEAEELAVITTNRLDESLRHAFGIDIPAQTALGVCGAELAEAALRADPSVGLLVPCTVVVRTEGEDLAVVEAPKLVMIVAITGDHRLEPVVADANARLAAAFARLSAHPG